MLVEVGFLVTLGLCLTPGGLATPLDDYVNKYDPTYKYEIVETTRGDNYTLYMLNMTSQTWKAGVVSQPVWWHNLSVIVPDTLDIQGAGFLFIGGGRNDHSRSVEADLFLMITTVMAVTTRSVGAYLQQIPNQPTTFKTDPSRKRRKEDSLIAWTWHQFIDERGADPEILLRLPMTKAGVRAMDTIHDLVQKKHGAAVDRFCVAGASKRGWTAWSVGAVDKRVVAITPIVMDLLNMVQSLHHYYRSLGGWSFTFNDYLKLNFTQNLDSPYMQTMASIIDPIAYNDRYVNIAKLITSSGGDEFFMIDDAKFYFDKLKGPKYLRQVPNAEHTLIGHEVSVLFEIRAFYLSVMKGKPLPILDWKLNTTATGGRITLTSDVSPSTVICYYATTLDGKRKDFRLARGTPGDPSKPEINPVFWFKKTVTQLSKNKFTIEMKNPDVGWTAFFIQTTFPGLEDSVLEFTTQTLIIPDTYPFPDCHGEQCRGTLV